MTDHSVLSTLEPSYLLNSTLNPDVNVAATTTAEAFSVPTSVQRQKNRLHERINAENQVYNST